MFRITQYRWTLCVLGMVIFITPRGALFAATADATRQIVIFVDGTSLAAQEQIVTLLGGQIIHVLSLINALAVQFPLADLTTIDQRLLSNPQVLGVSADSIAIQDQETSLTNELNTPLDQWFEWGQDNVHIHVPSAYSEGIRGSGVTVAVLDTGIDFYHLNLASNIVGGFNAIAVSPRESYYDYNGHGTHIAGIIAATPNQGKGLIGTASQAKLVAVKVLDATGSGYLSDCINGLQWVYDHGIPEYGVRVLNMSLSFARDSAPLQKAIYRLSQKGVIMVASAGNCGQAGGGVDEGGGADGWGPAAACDLSQPVQNAVLFPAAEREVIAVAATDNLHNVTNYSRYGPQVAVTAPGGAQGSARLPSTVPGGGYALNSGTSQAAAHASGVVALALQCQPSLSFNQVVTKLQATAHFNASYSSERQGAGEIDAAQLMQALQPCSK